jgi:hypothetical protein
LETQISASGREAVDQHALLKGNTIRPPVRPVFVDEPPGRFLIHSRVLGLSRGELNRVTFSRQAPAFALTNPVLQLNFRFGLGVRLIVTKWRESAGG